MVRVTALVLGVAVVSACAVRFDYSGTAFLCSDGVTCPDGFSCQAGVCIEDVSGSDSGSGNFAFTRRLLIDNIGRGELTGFTVLVTLDATRVDYGAVSADGSDIRFRDGDGSVLPHEIEQWDPDGISLVWVRVPTIDANSATDSIAFDYGSPGAADSSASNAVWSDYQAVYHLDESLTDSTSQGFDGTDEGSTATDGFIGPARAFNGTDQFISLGTRRPFVRNVAGFTLGVWVNPRNSAVDMIPFASSIDNGDIPSSQSRAQIIVLAGLGIEGDARTIDGGAIAAVISNAVIPADDWSWLTLVADFPADSLAIYINGADAGAATMLGLAAASADTVSTQTTIGVNDDGLSGFFAGAIDAVHLRNDVQDADWIAAQHASMTDALIIYGPEQSL